MKALLRGFARALPEEEILALSTPHGDSGCGGEGGQAPSRRALRARRRALLREAVAGHSGNWDPRSDAQAVRFTDDVGPCSKARALLSYVSKSRVTILRTLFRRCDRATSST